MLQTDYTIDHYTGTGALTDYAFTWRILQKNDLVAITKDTNDVVTTLTLDTDYTIDNAYVNNSSGGSIVLATALADGTQLFLTRQTDLTQLVHLEEGSPMPSSVLEEVFDRLTMITQELKYLFRQTLHFPDSSLSLDVEVADPTAGSLLQWNAAADGVQNVLASTLEITHTVVDVALNAGDSTAIVTHNLNNIGAKLIGFSSTFHTAFKFVSQTADTITVELTVQAPAGGGTLTFEVAI